MGRLLCGLAGTKIIAVTHEAPDGDAIGSLLALCSMLRSCGAEAIAVCADPLPEQYSFLPGALDILRQPPPGLEPHMLVYVDCATAERVGELEATLPKVALTLNIDHHSSNTRFATYNWVAGDASSTGEMIAELYMSLGLEFGVAAQALYTAMLTDTGSFSFGSTSAKTHRIAAQLLEAGVHPGEMHDRIYNNRDRAGLLLLARALSGLTLEADGRIAYMTLGPADFAAAGAGQQHADGFVNFARSIAGVRVGLLFYSLENGLVKIGIRTRPGVDASQLATAFGGGGHARAAGCKISGDLHQAVSSMLAVVKEHPELA